MRSPLSWLAALIFVTLPSVASAKPQHKQALINHLGPFFPNKLNDCRLCHVPAKPDEKEDAERPHNSFGARLAAVKNGKKTDIPERFEAIADEDADGDGSANLLELLSGHFPGDPNDKPSKEELAAARIKLLAFRKYQTGHPWRPYETVKRPDVPATKNAGWVRNPIDAFVGAQHEELALTPRPEAPRAVLLRRVFFDLIGLPPTRAELHAFLNDPSTDSYEKAVDRLLNSPQYGEAQARHWMDIWRYSDWAGWGAQVRDSQPHIWRWRDWIVESLNQDKGYDRMIQEMLAGDEFAPEDPNVLRATGYLVRNFKLLSREKWMQETVEHTFLAFQATTINCARCHDHIYDPILQKDYYQVRAIFEPHNVRLDRVPGQPDTKLDGLARVFDADAKALTYLFIRGDDRTPDKSSAIDPGVPAVLGGKLSVKECSLPVSASQPERRPFVMQELIANLEKTVALHDRELAKANLALGMGGRLAPMMAREAAAAAVNKNRLLAEVERLEDASKANTPEWEKAAKETLHAERHFAYLKARNDTFFLKIGRVPNDPKSKTPLAQRIAEAEKLLAKAEADLKVPLTTAYTKRQVTAYPTTSTGRRLAFARWLTDKANPLTARVAVNHVWLRHFGQAIVPSVFDFGRNGRLPSHPALLDWLSAEFMEKDWSLKKLHRLIVMSATYRQASTPTTENLMKDRDNIYLWRYLPHRIEAEKVRDAIIHVAGKLDGTMGGPDLDHHLGMTVARRSLYFRHAAEKQMEFLKLFDAASVTECYHRKESIVPQQALALFNSAMVIQHARMVARQLDAEIGSDPAKFIQAAFETILSRPPTATEVTECIAFLAEQAAEHAKTAPKVPGKMDANGLTPAQDPRVRARENLVHVLLNHHDFVTVR